MEGALVTLAKLDALIVSAVSSIRDYCTNKVDGPRQKLYYGTFHSCLLKVFGQLVCSFRQAAEEGGPPENSLLAFRTDTKWVSRHSLSDQEATGQNFHLVYGCKPKDVSWQ